MGFCKELVVRAGINAKRNNQDVAGFSDIDAAYQGWKGEKDYYQRMFRELYKDKHFIIGEEPEVGVVNGLAVLSGGEIPFGNIMRIGVTVTPQRGGSGEFHNIDKSAGMSGKTFTKSFLQVTSMIRELYQRTDRQLNFNLETSVSQCDGSIDYRAQALQCPWLAYLHCQEYLSSQMCFSQEALTQNQEKSLLLAE